MSRETWVPIVGFEGLYEVSDHGRVRGLRGKNGKSPGVLWPMRVAINPTLRYASISLVDKNGRSSHYLIHRLVAFAFIGSCPDGHECAHMDGDPENNRVENLKWATKRENQNHRVIHGTDCRGEKCYAAKLKESDVHEIRRLAKAGGMTYAEIGRIFGITPSPVRSIITRKTWKHI